MQREAPLSGSATEPNDKPVALDWRQRTIIAFLTAFAIADIFLGSLALLRSVLDADLLAVLSWTAIGSAALWGGLNLVSRFRIWLWSIVAGRRVLSLTLVGCMVAAGAALGWIGLSQRKHIVHCENGLSAVTLIVDGAPLAGDACGANTVWLGPASSVGASHYAGEVNIRRAGNTIRLSLQRSADRQRSIGRNGASHPPAQQDSTRSAGRCERKTVPIHATLYDTHRLRVRLTTAAPAIVSFDGYAAASAVAGPENGCALSFHLRLNGDYKFEPPHSECRYSFALRYEIALNAAEVRVEVVEHACSLPAGGSCDLVVNGTLKVEQGECSRDNDGA